MSTGINITKKIEIQEESVSITNDVNSINFIGAGVSASTVGDNVTVNVQGSVGATLYYLNESVSQAPYKEFSSIPTTAVEQTIPVSIAAGATTVVQSFQTASGVPNTTNIPTGLWSFYLHFSGTPTHDWIIYTEVYKRNLGGIETLLLITDSVPVTGLTAVPVMILTDGVFPSTSLLTTDRIVVKVIVTHVGSGSPQTITLHTEGTTNYSVGTTTLNQIVPTGAVTSVTGTAPVVSSGGTTPAISMPQANGSTDGYLDSADWTTFNGKVPSTRNITINGTTQDLSADRTWSVGTVTSAGITAGTGISLAGTNPITSSGSITVTNSAPDQTVVLNNGAGIGVSGTYPNFTVTNTDTGSAVTLGSAGGTETLVNDGTGPALATKGITAGTGISLSSTASALTVTNSAPDQTVVLTPSTGINVTGTYPNFTIANTAPDQTVALTAGTGISVTGTYPNFTIDSTVSDTNIYNTDGTFTGDRTATFTGNRVLFTGVNGITTISLDLRAATGPGNRYAKLSSTAGTITNFLSVSGSSAALSGTDSSTSETGSVSANSTEAVLSHTNGINLYDITANSAGLRVNNAFYLPTNGGTANQVLTSNGAGVASWQTPAAGSSNWNVTTQAGASYTAASNDYVLVNAATQTVTLPAAANGIRVGVKMINATVTNIRVLTPSAGVTIDGTDRSVTGLPIFNQYDAYTFVCDGTNWWIMG